MHNLLSVIATYSFLSRALIVGGLVTLCAALLGVTLVLRRFSMIGDGLSHVGFGALAVASVLGVAPLKIAIPVVAVAAILLLRADSKKIKGDSAIAVISTGALAIGVILISHSGTNTDIGNYLIGSLYAIDKNDMLLAIILCILVVASFLLLYTRIFAVTFDESFAKATGTKTELYNTILAILTAITVVIGMRLMGALLISALIVFPALSSMRIFKSFFGVTVSAVVVSIVSFLTGFFITVTFDGVPTGACITVVNLVIFVLFSVIERLKRRV